MANTSNFGWETPDDTDLVKDGALAIRTLAGAIDTSFVGVAVNAQTGATYTVVLADGLNKIVTMDNASANDFKIPTDASVAFPTGTVLNVFQKGAGITTISAVTPGTTTIVSTGAIPASPKLRLTNSAASAIKLSANSWLVVGDIA
jgi:hypothetical protein